MINYADKYKEMSDKWLTKRRRFLLNAETGYSGILNPKKARETFKSWSNEKIEAVLNETDAIEAILENRDD